ncbi:MAG: lysophospholipid acyltransferase family protein [Polyangiales bacterium]
MQTAIMRSFPDSLALVRTGVRTGARTGARTSSRAARVGAFTLETWSRLLVDGPSMGSDERARELSWVAENMCALHAVRLTVRGRVPSGPALLVANHLGYFDPLIIASLLPCTAIAKADVSAWPCIGELMRRLGVMFVERESAQSGARVLRETLRHLTDGVSVLVFPEGTTTTGETVLPFKRGSFGAATLAGVPIVPVAIHYECASMAWVGDATFLPHYLRTITKPYTRVTVDFLDPLPRAGSAEALAEQARRAIVEVRAKQGLAEARCVPRFADVSVATA